MRKDDTVRLRHMLDAAREAMSFVRGRTIPDGGRVPGYGRLIG